MKKLLFLTIGSFLALSSSAQLEVQQGRTLDASNSFSKNKAMNDTVPPALCNDWAFTYYTYNNRIITGTCPVGVDTVITDVGQYLNQAGDTLDVYSLLAYTAYKAEGPSKGSFTASIYDTTDGISELPIATSTPIGFDDISDTNSASFVNEFVFSNPVRVMAPFWAVVDVDNGSDTLSLLSSQDGCGVNSILRISDTQWFFYAQVFSGLSISAHIWATVDTNVVGLDRNFISRDGLKFYPNPASDMATIEFDLPSENVLTLIIQDVTGREIYREEKTFNGEDRKFSVNVSNFNSGAYTYQVVGTKSQLNGVFIRE